MGESSLFNKCLLVDRRRASQQITQLVDEEQQRRVVEEKVNLLFNLYMS